MLQENRKKFGLIIFALVAFIVIGSSLAFVNSLDNSESKAEPNSKPSKPSGPKFTPKPVQINKKELDPVSDTEAEPVSSSPVDRIYIPVNRDKKFSLYSILADGKDLQTLIPESPFLINHVQKLEAENQLVLSLTEAASGNRAYRFDLKTNTLETTPIADSDTSQLEFSPDRTKISYISNGQDHYIANAADLKIASKEESDHLSGYYVPRYAPSGVLMQVNMNTVMRDIHPDHPFDSNARDDHYSLLLAKGKYVKLEDKPQEMFISSDGKNVILKTFDRTEGHELSIVDVDSKAIQTVYHQNITCYGWSSDNSAIFFSKPDSDKQILYKLVLNDDGKHKVYKIKNEKGEIVKL